MDPSPLRRLVGPLLRAVRSASARQDVLAEWRRRLRGEPALPQARIRNVLVLCHGNICRSPFAALLLEAGRSALEVRSAGLGAADGHSADPSARRLARRFGVSLEAHRSRLVTGRDLEEADLILVMQGSQARAVRALSRRAWDRTRILGDFLPAAPHLIADPWGRDEDVFEDTFNRIARAVEQLGLRLDDASRERPGRPARG